MAVFIDFHARKLLLSREFCSFDRAKADFCAAGIRIGVAV
jgi:hypothetical protein